MDARPHRFLQYLQELGPGELWHEQPALDGGAVGARRSVRSVRTLASGRLAREIKQGIRLVIKWVARLLYLSPLLIALRLVVGLADREAGDLVVFGFVLLVVTFFVLLNFYIVWSVVTYFRARGRRRVQPAFEEGGGAAEELLGRSGGELVRRRGTIARLCPPLAGGTDVLHDLWSLEAESPWRLTECVDFALLTEGEPPLILRFESAPLVVAEPERQTVGWGAARFSPATDTTFDLRPALGDGGTSLPGCYLSLSEEQTVEVVGRLSGIIANTQRFELGRRVCMLQPAAGGAYDPYRGVSGEEGLLVVATTEHPIVLRRL